jgi:hypothetical protein
LSAGIQHGAASLTLGMVGVGAATAGLAVIALEGFWAGEETLIPVWDSLACSAAWR